MNLGIKNSFKVVVNKFGDFLDFWSKEKDEQYYVNLGLFVVIFGLGGFLLWACFAPLDKGVSATGYVITSSNRQAIQPSTTGIIDEILVREGSQVKAGEILVRLNPTNAAAQTTAMEQSIGGLEAQARGLEESLGKKKQQVFLLKQQLANVKQLSQEGYYPVNRSLELERQYLQLAGSVADDEGNLVRVQKQIAEQQSKIKANEYELSNTELKSPVDGQVVNLAIFTKGGVVTTGSKLMEVIPEKEALIIEGQLPVHLVDKVMVGQLVEMMFTAFNQNRTPHIEGVLISVGADRITDERSGAPYYKIQVNATEQGVKLLGTHKIRPGMPVDIFIKTGERSMMSYLLKPVLDRSHSAMREE
jgi:protease secretion system membrane fusion protein